LVVLAVLLFAVWPVVRQPRLEADDYRYLHHIQQWKLGELTAIEAMTVENRWDHLWFMEEEGVIRFFRPTVVLSYGIDRFLWGDAYALGLSLTNIGIHLLCTLLVGLLFCRLMGSGWIPVLGAALFAGLAAHAECIWYIAGRTDSLAALGFLGALVLHAYGRRYGALPLFTFGLLTKELVIFAPVVFAAYDRWIDQRKMDWKLYSVYAVLSVILLVLKKVALGGAGSDFVYPYLISPFSPEFPHHLWLQFRSYAGNLLAAELTVPFADAETVGLLNRAWVPMVGIPLFLAMVWGLRNDRRVWFFLLLGVLAWLPTSFVYLSERYLYLPSIAFVGVLVLFVAQCSKPWKGILAGLLALYTGFQTLELYQKQAAIAGQDGSVEELLEQLEPVRDQIEPDDSLLLVNLPGYFVRAQFIQDILRVAWNQPNLQVHVLTMMPGQNGTEWKPGDAFPVMGAGVEVLQPDEKTVQLRGRSMAAGQPPHRVMEDGQKAFRWLPLKTGQATSNTVFTVAVVADDGVGATALDFHFFQPLENPRILMWRSDCTDLNEHPWKRRRAATVQLNP
jgi:hypothetical protein